MHSCVDEYSQPTIAGQHPTSASYTSFKIYSSPGNSGVGGGSNSNTRSSGSIVFMFCVKTLVVAWVNFIAMKGSLLREQ